MDDEIAAQFARAGARKPPTGADTVAPVEAFEVMPANGPAIDAWLAVETQWRVAAGPGGLVWIGLDYVAVDIVLRRLEVEDPDGVFRDLQQMESAALAVLWEAKS